jgi:hypothetical protein
MIQTDVTTEETGIPGSPVDAMSESDETHLGETERRTGIGRRGKARRVGMQNPSQRRLWIQRQGNLRNRTVHLYSSLVLH